MRSLVLLCPLWIIISQSICVFFAIFLSHFVPFHKSLFGNRLNNGMEMKPGSSSASRSNGTSLLYMKTDTSNKNSHNWVMKFVFSLKFTAHFKYGTRISLPFVQPQIQWNRVDMSTAAQISIAIVSFNKFQHQIVLVSCWPLSASHSVYESCLLAVCCLFFSFTRWLA